MYEGAIGVRLFFNHKYAQRRTSLNTASAENIAIPTDVQVQKTAKPRPEGWIGTQAYRVNAAAGGKREAVALVPYADASQKVVK